MKRSTSLMLMLALCTASTAEATVVNLANSATGFGLLPVIVLNQGTAAGIADGSLFSWFGSATSPRTFAGTNIQPYMTWGSAQDVRIIRAHRDASGDWDRFMIDTLVGVNPAIEANWVNRYDSGPGLTVPNSRFQDVDLGTTYSTLGVRVRSFRPGGDTDVGEVAVFGQQDFAGNLTSLKAAPTSFAASSTEHRAPNLAVNGDWYDGGWLSHNTTVNPGTDFTYDLFFAGGQDINGVSYAWTTQGGFSVLPTSWELLIDNGLGLTSLGLFAPQIAQNGTSRLQYYFDFGLTDGIQQIRLRVPESAASRIGLVEFEAFLTTAPVPEPATFVLVGLGMVMLSRRRSLFRSRS